MSWTNNFSLQSLHVIIYGEMEFYIGDSCSTRLFFSHMCYFSFSFSNKTCIICITIIDDENLEVQLRQKGCDGIISASKARGKDMHPEPGHWVHKECLCIYCISQQTEKDSRMLENEQPSCVSPTLKSGSSAFLSNGQYLFCSQIIKCDTKKQGRDIHNVTELSMAKEIERICNLRNDEWVEKGRFSLKSMTYQQQMLYTTKHAAQVSEHIDKYLLYFNPTIIFKSKSQEDDYSIQLNFQHF